MAVQFLPILKAVLPYVAQIATAAIPAFTAKPEAAKSDPVVAMQIEELQAAATQNAQSIHTLADKMQLAIQGLEAATQDANQKIATYKTMLLVSLCTSCVSLAACVYLLVR